MRSLLFMWADGRLFGGAARLREILVFHGDIVDRLLFIACGVAVAGVPSKPDAVDDLYLLSYNVATDGIDKFYRHSHVIEKATEKEDAAACR